MSSKIFSQSSQKQKEKLAQKIQPPCLHLSQQTHILQAKHIKNPKIE